jgi:hypothetical protein
MAHLFSSSCRTGLKPAAAAASEANAHTHTEQQFASHKVELFIVFYTFF